MVFGNGVKSIQAAAYNGACTVVEFAWADVFELKLKTLQINPL